MEAQDLAEKCRKILDKEGLTYTNRFGAPQNFFAPHLDNNALRHPGHVSRIAWISPIANRGSLVSERPRRTEGVGRGRHFQPAIGGDAGGRKAPREPLVPTPMIASEPSNRT